MASSQLQLLSNFIPCRVRFVLTKKNVDWPPKAAFCFIKSLRSLLWQLAIVTKMHWWTFPRTKWHHGQVTIPVLLIFGSRAVILLASKNYFVRGHGFERRTNHAYGHRCTLPYFGTVSATIKVLRDFDLLAHFSHHDVFHIPSSFVSKFILLWEDAPALALR